MTKAKAYFIIGTMLIMCAMIFMNIMLIKYADDPVRELAPTTVYFEEGGSKFDH